MCIEIRSAHSSEGSSFVSSDEYENKLFNSASSNEIDTEVRNFLNMFLLKIIVSISSIISRNLSNCVWFNKFSIKEVSYDSNTNSDSGILLNWNDGI